MTRPDRLLGSNEATHLTHCIERTFVVSLRLLLLLYNCWYFNPTRFLSRSLDTLQLCIHRVFGMRFAFVLVILLECLLPINFHVRGLFGYSAS